MSYFSSRDMASNGQKKEVKADPTSMHQSINQSISGICKAPYIIGQPRWTEVR